MPLGPDAEEFSKKTKSGAGSKTSQAFMELVGILSTAAADGIVVDDEIAEILIWRERWLRVLKQPRLRPFAEWLDEAMQDGAIDSEERIELMAWAKRMEDVRHADDHGSVKSRDLVPLTGKLAENWRETVDWRDQPATPKQIAFLKRLGVDADTIPNLTKRKAGGIICSKIRERDKKAESAPIDDNVLVDFPPSDHDHKKQKPSPSSKNTKTSDACEKNNEIDNADTDICDPVEVADHSVFIPSTSVAAGSSQRRGCLLLFVVVGVAFLFIIT